MRHRFLFWKGFSGPEFITGNELSGEGELCRSGKAVTL
jgi:hypothetical protein